MPSAAMARLNVKPDTSLTDAQIADVSAADRAIWNKFKAAQEGVCKWDMKESLEL